MKKLLPWILWCLFVASSTYVIAQSASSSKSDSGSLFSSGSAPTVSACGTSPTVVTGNNYAGRLTTGSGPLTSCTLTFVPAFTVAPVCQADVTGGSIEDVSTTVTTTTLVITGGDITSNPLSYICIQIP